MFRHERGRLHLGGARPRRSLAFLAVDFFLFGRRGITFRSSAIWSVFWLALGISFTLVMWAWQGTGAAGEYLSGYLIERSLSIDNIFVFAAHLRLVRDPAGAQGRLLSIGIVMALVMRAAFIGAGALLLDAFHFTIYLFGLLLVATGVKLARHSSEEVHPERNIVLRRCAASGPARRVTVAVVVVLATTDLIFAIDSIPAIFADHRRRVHRLRGERVRAARPALALLPARRNDGPLRVPDPRTRHRARLGRCEDALDGRLEDPDLAVAARDRRRARGRDRALVPAARAAALRPARPERRR